MVGNRLPYGAPLPPEVPYPIHEPQKQVRMSNICCCAIASSSPRSELLCFNVCIILQIIHIGLIFTTSCTGAPYVTKRLPPPSLPLWRRHCAGIDIINLYIVSSLEYHIARTRTSFGRICECPGACQFHTDE